MRLEKVRVTHFRSVNDSNEFAIDDEVTCLVGKNESGKSALLLALAALNPSADTPVELIQERDYPRRFLTQYSKRHRNGEAAAIQTDWTLADEEVGAISDDVGEGVLTSNRVRITRSYNEAHIRVIASCDEKVAIEHLFNRYALNAIERNPLSKVQTTRDLQNLLADDLSERSPKQQELLQHLEDKGTVWRRIYNHVKSFLPVFMYVSSYDRMAGAIQIEDTQRRISNDALGDDTATQLFVDFLNMAEIPLDEITNVQTFESFRARLQGASIAITDQLLPYWSQNPDLEVVVSIDKALPKDPAPFNTGTIARARIENKIHKVDTPFSERSAGFVWFFSFLVKFETVKRRERAVILLLDEPGLSLHGRAQADLLQFFDDQLAPYHQVIYSTHSPFMVSADKWERVRIVEDRVDRNAVPVATPGTKVTKEVLQVDPHTLFPLQGALGYEVTQTLFVGANVLLVEGPSDLLYLQALSHALRSKGREGLDSRWTICPAGGIDKITPFVSLFGGSQMRVAVLSDYGRGGKNTVARIRSAGILQTDHFHTVADFIDSADEADTEDLFDRRLLVDIVNGSYALRDSDLVTVAELAEYDRVVEGLEARFKVLDSGNGYSHFRPSEWLVRNLEVLEGDSAPVNRTLDNAEKVFKAYNRLLD